MTLIVVNDWHVHESNDTETVLAVPPHCQLDHMSSMRLAHAAAVLAVDGADVFASCINTAMEVVSCSVPPAPASFSSPITSRPYKVSTEYIRADVRGLQGSLGFLVPSPNDVGSKS